VRTHPGHIEFTAIPSACSSADKMPVTAFTAAFEIR